MNIVIDESNIKHIVDGQRRLSSFSVLIKAIYDVIQSEEDVSEIFKKNHLSMLEKLLTGTAYDNNGSAAPRLILNGNTGKCFNNEILKLRENDSYKKSYRGAKRILNAYKLFKNEINDKKVEFIEDKICVNVEDFFKKLVNIIRLKITFIEIECDASSDAFQVFDSLNGKGLDLTAANRIKNIMMSFSPMGKDAQKWDALVEYTGEDYLTSFFVSLFFFNRGKRISKNKLPDEFKNKYKNLAQSDFNLFYNELKNDAMIYGNLRMNKTGVKELDDLLKDFNSLKLDQIYVILFAIAKYFGDQIFNDKKYIEFTQNLLSLIVRMQVCEKSMNRLDNIFSELIDTMKKQGDGLVELCKRLKDKKEIIAPNSQFKLDFENFSPKDSKVGEFYVRSLENYMRKESGNKSPVEDGLTVEHIIPQTLDYLSEWYEVEDLTDDVIENFKDIVENIGNKMLLYGDDNSSAGNKIYKDKLETYKNGKRGQNQDTPVETFQMVKELVEKYPLKFTHEEVKDRAKYLSEIAVKIW